MSLLVDICQKEKIGAEWQLIYDSQIKLIQINYCAKRQSRSKLENSRGGGAHIHAFEFTDHENNRCQKKYINMFPPQLSSLPTPLQKALGLLPVLRFSHARVRM